MVIRVEELIDEICDALGVEYIETLDSGAQKSAVLVEKNEQVVALKIAKSLGSSNARFEREIRALKACDHPSIAHLYHVSLEKIRNVEVWVMLEEYLPGGTLTDVKALGSCTLRSIVSVAQQLISALEHLRARGIVHRDIKPANILFRDEKTPVLTDFGIARVLAEPSLTKDFLPQGPGTPLYASPEQLINDKPLIDWRSDQFGLAVVLAEWKLGHHPFQDGPYDAQQIVEQVAERRGLPARVESELNDMKLNVLVKAMSPWPISRYRTTSQFLDALPSEE